MVNPDHFPTETAGLPQARPSTPVDFAAGDRLDLRISPVVKRIGKETVRMLAYNGSIPGPTLRVRQGTELTVNVVNEGDLETTVHWHGLRLGNQFDGTTDTQRPIPVGGAFTYRLSFPDPGVYWYHPHIREDYTQELGLYGNIVVEPSEPGYWPSVDREITLALDDILLENGRVAPFRRSSPTHAAMGRFGNLLLVNGDPNPSLQARVGEIVRFYLTNTANTRIFNVALPGALLKLVGGDSGHYEREEFVERVLIAPSERAVVDVLFDQPGPLTLEHHTPARTYPLASITVEPGKVEPSRAGAFGSLGTNADMAAWRKDIVLHWKAEPDKTLSLVAEMEMEEPESESGNPTAFICPMHPDVTSDAPGRCPRCGMKLIRASLLSEMPGEEHHHGHGHGEHHESPEGSHHGRHPENAEGVLPDHDGEGIEWEDDMVTVNRMTTPDNTRWKLIDRDTDAEGSAIDWQFCVGDLVKIRLINETDSDHPMQHPFHLHGAGRFLILSRDGAIEPNLVWKDTVLVRTGQTVDILLEVTNPGVWMAHCHIAEHHESGMMFRFRVDP